MAMRPHLARTGESILETGWQDVAEAMADIDTTLAAIELGRPYGAQRGEFLLSRGGPLHELSVIDGWEQVFLGATRAQETRAAAE